MLAAKGVIWVGAGAVRTVLVVLGLRDNASRERVVEALEAVEGVVDVDVNLHRARATIVHTPACAVDRLVEAVVRAGYGAAPEAGIGRSAASPPASGADAPRAPGQAPPHGAAP